MSVTQRRRLPLVVIGLAVVVGATACGGSSKGSTPVAAAAATTTTSTDPANAYTACLRQHGANVPDRPARTSTTLGTGSTGPSTSRTPRSFPAGGRPSTTLPPGVDANALAAARQACASLMPTGGPNGQGPQGQAFQAYISCLKDHGVTVPDTTGTTLAGGTGGNGGPGGLGGLAGINRDDPTFKAADAICAPLRPMPSTTTSTTVKP